MYFLPNSFAEDYPKNEESDRITATSKMLTWNQ